MSGDYSRTRQQPAYEALSSSSYCPRTARRQELAEELRKRFRLPVHLWDERLTSAEANRLLRETELSIEKRAKAVDRMAAVLILQGWMEGREGGRFVGR